LRDYRCFLRRTYADRPVLVAGGECVDSDNKPGRYQDVKPDLTPASANHGNGVLWTSGPGGQWSAAGAWLKCPSPPWIEEAQPLARSRRCGCEASSGPAAVRASHPTMVQFGLERLHARGQGNHPSVTDPLAVPMASPTVAGDFCFYAAVIMMLPCCMQVYEYSPYTSHRLQHRHRHRHRHRHGCRRMSVNRWQVLI
jgi:hypothetical protein